MSPVQFSYGGLKLVLAVNTMARSSLSPKDRLAHVWDEYISVLSNDDMPDDDFIDLKKIANKIDKNKYKTDREAISALSPTEIDGIISDITAIAFRVEAANIIRQQERID